MPTISILPPVANRSDNVATASLPETLRTPAGLAIVEIQGTVNASSMIPRQDSSSHSIPVGKLVFPLYDEARGVQDTSWQKRVHLFVGKHQRLTGQVTKLSKPIAILRRKAVVDSATGNEELEIAEIVYYKILFAHRPEPATAGNGAD